MVISSPFWKKLREQYLVLKSTSLRSLFKKEADRADFFSFHHKDLFVDFSKNLISRKVFKLLINLAKDSNLNEKIEAMFEGEKINKTEGQSVLHTALRNLSGVPVFCEGKDVMPGIFEVLDQMSDFVKLILDGKWKGSTGKPIKNLVNIGIGGSDLGPNMAYEALKHYSDPSLKVFFVSNIDPTHLKETLTGLNPEETLFVIVSKTFTTVETLTNAKSAKDWLDLILKEDFKIHKHFVAVSTNIEKAEEFGIDPRFVFAFWDWVGGRYSLTSAVGLSLMVSIGPDHFMEFLEGFHQMDQHFRMTDFEENIPVIMALIGIWYNNFWDAESVAILPYDQYLRNFPSYLQQADMESNGKQVDINGEKIYAQTGPVIWGASGTNGQHAFFQLIHQGTKLIPCDFIGFMKSLNPLLDQHTILMSNFFAQQEALAFGKNKEELKLEGVSPNLIPFKEFQGNRPSTCILFSKLTPQNLGNLIALYEHKIFVQGVLWNINSFDQWGVEFGKVLANQIYEELQAGKVEKHDPSTEQQMKLFLDQV